MKKSIKVSYLIEDEQEIKLLDYLLDYCWHRATQHGQTPVSQYKDQINKLRKQFYGKLSNK